VAAVVTNAERELAELHSAFTNGRTREVEEASTPGRSQVNFSEVLTAINVPRWFAT
jgi:hypothetical protein